MRNCYYYDRLMHSTLSASARTGRTIDLYNYVLDERLQPTSMFYLVGRLSGAQVEYKPVDLQSYEARSGASLACYPE